MPVNFENKNIGDWSELYTFLHLLAEGKLNIADENLVAIPDAFYKVLEILRRENEINKNYIRKDSVIHIVIHNSDSQDEFDIPVQTFSDKSNELLYLIKSKQNKSILKDFFEEISVESIKDVGHKRDVTITIEDCKCSLSQELGFSIKSLIGGASTIFNPGSGTNFIYRIIFPAGTKFDVRGFNDATINMGSKIHDRIVTLENDYNAKIEFVKTQSNTLMNNMQLIDGDLPKIVAYSLLERYRLKKSSMKDCVEALNRSNPLNYSDLNKFPFYEYKIKRFLHDVALGMTCETPWTGVYDANGGFIIVKDSGEVVCYHIYEQNRFLNYLYNNTKFEQASTGEDADNPGCPRLGAKPYYYGWVYEEDGEYYIKINLQIRMGS